MVQNQFPAQENKGPSSKALPLCTIISFPSKSPESLLEVFISPVSLLLDQTGILLPHQSTNGLAVWNLLMNWLLNDCVHDIHFVFTPKPLKLQGWCYYLLSIYLYIYWVFMRTQKSILVEARVQHLIWNRGSLILWPGCVFQQPAPLLSSWGPETPAGIPPLFPGSALPALFSCGYYLFFHWQLSPFTFSSRYCQLLGVTF